MWTIVYLCGFCLFLYGTVVGYENIVQKIGGYNHPLWMSDLVIAILVTLWPLMLPGVIRGFYLGFKQAREERRRSR